MTGHLAKMIHTERCLFSLAKRLSRAVIGHHGNRSRFTTSSTPRSGLKMSYCQGSSSVPLLGTTVGQQMAVMAEAQGQKEAFVCSEQNARINFEQLLEQSDRLAAGLMSLGIRRGDRVGIWAPNCLEWVLAQYGTARAGIILVNINPAYRVAEMEFAMRKVGLKALIASPTFKTSNYYQMIREIVPEIAHDRPGDLQADNLPELRHVIMMSDDSFPGTMRFYDVMDMETPAIRREINDLQRHLQFDDVINIQFTSGTTGLPKGAALSHHNLINNAYYVGRVLDYHVKESRICNSVPLYHCFGMVLGSMASIVHGACVVLPAGSFDPIKALQSAETERCTTMYGTPTMFIDILAVPDLEKYDLSSLYNGIMAGASCPIEVMKKLITTLHLPSMTIAYGTTENSPVTAQTPMDTPIEKRVSTVGQVAAQTEAKIVDESGKVVPVGVTGELCIRGYCVMRGYWHDDEKTSEAIGEDRWYKTGDLSTMDEEGFIDIVGRSRDMIIRGGENIYPTEVEQFLYKHPKILDVQVLGIPDDRLGEIVCACVKLKENETSTENEIRDFCKEQIAHFKIPQHVIFVREFPMTVTGKIQKFKLREEILQLGL